MSVDIKRVDRSIVLVILFLGLVTYTLGEPAKLNYCQTEDCQTTAKEFDKLINWDADTCADFYQFACGSGPPEELAGYRTQDQYLSEQLVNVTSNEDTILTLDPSPSDPLLLQLMKRYYRSCADQGALNAAGLQPIIRLLVKAADHKSWWKLENWAVSLGLNSSLFSVEIDSHMYREDKKGAIILVPPHTPIYRPHYLDLSIKVIEKLTAEGMDLHLATKLRNGLVKEFDFYDIVQEPTLPERHNYGERNPVPLTEWNSLWNTHRKSPSHPKIMNWENYVNNYWKNSVTSKVIVPLINNGMYKTWIAYPKFIETLGSKVEKFSPGDMNDMILWRITNQLIQYAGQDTRNILNLEPINPSNCKTPAMQDVALKDHWWKIYPKTIRTPIRKMYANIDLQVKLLNYKKMPKVLPDKEALTPRERREHDELNRMSGILTKKVQSILLELNTAEADLKRIKAEKYPWWCTDNEHGSSDCVELIREYHRSQKRIPELTKQVTVLSRYFSAKQEEMFRCLHRIKSFEEKHAGHPYVIRIGYTADHIALRNYVRDHQYPGKFPYQNTITQPALIIEPPSPTETYVDLALSLKRWERGMLLRETESFSLVRDVEDFIINTISQGTFARFRNNRASSLNYGALGSVIGAQLWRKLNMFQRDGFAKVEECVARGFSRGSGPQLIYDTIWDIFSVSNLRYALQAAWIGFKRTIAITGEHDVRLVKDTNVKDEKISELSDKKLFFLAFANEYCSKEPDNSSHFFIDTILGITPQFKEVFECSDVSKSFPADPCVPERNPEDADGN